MGRIRWQERIVVAPDLHHGDPCIKGTRVPVAIIVGSLADGMTPEEIQDNYPQLTGEDIRAALAYAADVMHQDVLVSLSAQEMAMRVKVDEDLPQAAVQVLRDRGYRAVSAVEQGMGGYKDPPL